MEEKIITAIDLGTSKFVGLCGRKTPEGFQIVAACEAPSQGVTRGEVVNNQLVLSALRPILTTLSQTIGKPITEAVVGITGQWVRCAGANSSVTRSSKDGEIQQREIDQMLQSMFDSRVDASEVVLHVIPQSYRVDDYDSITEPVGMCGKSIEANYRLFIGRQNTIQNTRRCLENAQVKMVHLVLEPLASAAAILQDDEKELGVAMVDIGSGTTDVLIYQDNIVRYSAVIPFGGGTLTSDIAIGCEVTRRQAEQMKIQYGSCYADLMPENKSIVIPGIGGKDPREVPFRVLAEIIEARMSEILDAVFYHIDQSGYGGKLPGGLVLTGGGARMANLPELIKYKSGYDVRIAHPSQVDTQQFHDFNSVTHSCAVGLLMKGFEPLEEAEYKARKEKEEERLLQEVHQGLQAKEEKAKRNKRSKGGLFASLFDSDNQA